MAPHDMKLTWKDIFDGLFPSKERCDALEKAKIDQHHLIGKIITDNLDNVPVEVFLRSDYVRDYNKYKDT